MQTKPICDYIEPSEEIRDGSDGITSSNLLDEVNLYNLYDDADSPEQDAERILGITYPTRTLKTIVDKTCEKFASESTVSQGAHVIGGEYGSGKSHIELVVYHLLDAPTVADDWVARHGIDADLPSDARTVALQMLNLDADYNRLQTAVGDHLGIDEWGSGDPPGALDIRDAVGDRPTAVFIDEFERWFGISSRSAYKPDNLAFLQNLLEAANRDDTPLTVYVSLLFEESAVEDVLPRTNPFRHDLSQSREEKIRFLVHRLVGSVTDSDGVRALAKEYTDVYRNNKQVQLSGYQEMQTRIERYYPFHPTALDALMDKFSEQQGSQDARGLLELLTKLLADNYHETDLILTGDVDVCGFSGWFRFVDRELVGKYLNDYHRLGDPLDDENDDRRVFDEYVEELLNTVLIHSLARGGEEGANKHRMLMGTLRKGENAHQIVQTFKNRVFGHAWHVFRINGEYSFDTEENPAARIEKKAEDVHKDDAIHRIERLVSERLFDDRNNVYTLDPVNTEQEIPDNKTLKFVVSLSAHRGYDDQFEALTTGQEREYSNTIILVTPEKASSVDTNTGIRELARKVVAGELLLQQDGQALPDGFDDVHEQNLQSLHDRVLDKYGEVHVPTGRGLFPEELPADDDSLYESAREIVTPDRSQLRSKVETRVEDEQGGVQYRFLRNDFYRSESLPTLTDESELRDAVDDLCREGRIQVGTYFEESVGSLGSETTIVHETYVDDPGGGGDGETITIDTTTSGDEPPGRPDSGGAVSVSDTEREQTVLECPQCGSELDGTTCECGFAFDATDVEDGTVKLEDDDITLGDIVGETGSETDEPNVERVPAYGTLDAADLPTLIDTLERTVSASAAVHTVELSYTGTLPAAAAETRGLDGDLVEHVETDETLDITFSEPITRDELLTRVLIGVDLPDDASLEVALEVTA